MSKDLHQIQKSIVLQLKNAKSRKYSELNSGGVSNDLFNYHLQYLVKNNTIEKTSTGYSLSLKGNRLVADPALPSDSLSSLYKMNVITIAIKRIGKEIYVLNQHRKSNPSFGKVGVMGGIVHKGERICDAAKRKFREETGLNGNFVIVGSERRMLYENNELFSDIVFMITYSEDISGDLVITGTHGENEWVLIEQAIENESSEYDSIKTIRQVLELIKANKIDNSTHVFNETIQKALV